MSFWKRLFGGSPAKPAEEAAAATLDALTVALDVPFFRGRGCNQCRGTGYKGRLGLHGMRQRIEVLGGAIDIQSAPGQGTRIQVMLPLQATMPESE